MSSAGGRRTGGEHLCEKGLHPDADFAEDQEMNDSESSQNERFWCVGHFVLLHEFRTKLSVTGRVEHERVT